MKKPNKLFFIPSSSISEAQRAANKNSFQRGGGREREREKEKVVKTKKAVYFMITALTSANNFDIMKGMMNIKHIKIKISI